MIIHIDPNSRVIQDEVLEQVVEIYQRQKTTTIEISGHVSAGGTREYELALSTANANYVWERLMTMGANPSHMNWTGYGQERIGAMPEEGKKLYLVELEIADCTKVPPQADSNTDQ